jgi:hypothetical protein
VSHEAGAAPDASWECFTPAGLRVLVVDDDKLCLKVVSKMLQQCNYEGVRSYMVAACSPHEVQAAKRRSVRPTDLGTHGPRGRHRTAKEDLPFAKTI